MASNRAQILISAVDQTKTAFDSIKRGLGGLTDTAKSVNGVLANLGVAVSVAGLTAMVKSAIDTGDDAKNTLFFDFVTMGELFQNNHHKYGQRPNFAVRWFEVDPAYQVMRVLDWMGVIKLGEKPRAADRPAAEAVATP